MLESVGNMNKIYARTRWDRFLDIYIRNGFCNVYRSALEAGYAETTARAQGKRILDTALRRLMRSVVQ